MSRIFAVLLAIAATSAVVLTLRSVGALEAAELAAYDMLVRASTRSEAAPDIVVIAATERDLREIGHWPISDRVLGESLERLRTSEAAVIGIDWYRDFAVPPGEAVLQQALRGDHRIIGVSLFGDEASPGVPGHPVLEASGRVGFNDFPTEDRDASVRRGLLFQDDGHNEVKSSFAFQLATRALAPDGIGAKPDPLEPEWLRLGANTLPPLPSRFGGYAGIDDAGYQLMLEFPHDRFQTFGFGQLRRGEIDPDALRGKVVLLGSNSESLPDQWTTPLGTRVGLEIHAHLVDQLLRHARGVSAPLRWLPEWAVLLMVTAFAGLGCLVSSGFSPATGRAGPRLALGLVLICGFLVAVRLAFQAGWWLPVAAPVSAALLGAGATAFWIAGRERAEHAQVMGLFSRHVSAEVAEEVWNHRAAFMDGGRPLPRRLDATVLFLDIRGFTEASEQLDPAVVMDWTNRFMDAMADEVRRANGVVDDYFGDGLKATFGVPIARTSASDIAADAVRAVACARAMRSRLEPLNVENRKLGLPAIAMRVGIHSGSVVAGSLGSSDRLKYTVMGSVVNTAARLEATKDVAHDFDADPCRILLSRETRDLTGEGLAVGEVRLSGFSAAIDVFRA